MLTELPFGNRLVTIEIGGADLRRAIENGLSLLPNAAGRFPQVSGLTIVYAVLAALLRRNRAQTRYRLWLAASLKFAIPFSLLMDFGARFDGRTIPAALPLFGSSRTYEVAPLIRMYIAGAGPPGFDHLATLSDPAARPEDFVGPWNASIRSIVVRGNKIDVHAHLVFGLTETLDIPRIERLPGHPADPARLRALGCPSGAPWGPSP